MTEARGNIAGVFKEHRVKLYALSTCIWCKKTRQFLEEQQIEFEYVYVDLLQDAEREIAKDQVREWNPRCSFPTLVIDDATCIVGYKTDEIKAILGA